MLKSANLHVEIENRQLCDLNSDKNFDTDFDRNFDKNLQSYTHIPFQKHYQGLLHSCMKSGTMKLRILLKMDESLGSFHWRLHVCLHVCAY